MRKLRQILRHSVIRLKPQLPRSIDQQKGSSYQEQENGLTRGNGLPLDPDSVTAG